MNPLETVNAFLEAVGRKDLDTALALLADDVEYDNVPMPTVNGVQGVREFLEPFLLPAEELDWVVHRQAADGHVVFNERSDRFLLDGKWMEIPVTGVWEVHDGKITLWRDYFDLQMVMSQAPPT
jgi:limonene-1,2-epoxide hydrolase